MRAGLGFSRPAARALFLAYYLVAIGKSMTLWDQRRRRSISATICLLVVVLLYAPLAGAAWSSYQSACCRSGQCAIAGHHHHKSPATPSNHMDCGHDMSGMMACSMSCCHDTDRSLAVSITFVLPQPVMIATPAAVKSPIGSAIALDFPRSIEPLSPPPRFVFAAA